MESAQQHDSKQASPAPVSFKPALLGAGLLFSVFLNAIRFFSEHGTGATPSLHPFAVYAGWGQSSISRPSRFPPLPSGWR